MEGDPAREAWSIVFELAMENRARLMAALEELELTFMQAHVLRLLDPEKPRPMGELADTLKCDASNITGIVDRLEARGLVAIEPKDAEAAAPRRLRLTDLDRLQAFVDG